MPPTARDRLIETAADLFARHGFGPVGLDRVIAEVGTTKTTFYNHFTSRDDLIIEVLKHRDHQEIEDLIADITRRAGDDPRARILAIFDTFDAWFRETDFRGCMFLNAATEFPDPNDPINQTATIHGRHLAELIRDLAARAGVADPEALSSQISVLLTGAIIHRQVGKQINAALAAKAAATAILDASLGARRRSRS